MFSSPLNQACVHAGKRRRSEGGFLGSDHVLQQLTAKPVRRRVGLVSREGPPARSGAEVLSREGEVVGVVTSGCPSPTLGHNVAMAYVPRKISKTGTELELRIRKKTVAVKVAKMPFTPAKYYTAS